jgi:glycosyltransferase involved in cell wall biosynthesis
LAIYDGTWKAAAEQWNPQVLVIWQRLPDLRDIPFLRKFNTVLAPMYDQVRDVPANVWTELLCFKFLCFSRELYLVLNSLGARCYHCQYFPKQEFHERTSSELSCLFWQREVSPDLATIEKVLPKNAPMNLYYRSDIEGKTARLPANMRLREFEWTKGREAYLDIVRNCTLYFAPRFWQGIGMSFLEAMATGACVIAANRPTMNEYIENGKNGYLYEPTNPAPVDLVKLPIIQRNLERFVRECRKRYEDSTADLRAFLFEGPGRSRLPLRANLWRIPFLPIFWTRRLAWKIRGSYRRKMHD